MDKPSVIAGAITREFSEFDAEGGTHIMVRSQEVGNSIFCGGNSAVAVSQETYCSPTSIVWIEDETLISYYYSSNNNSLVFSISDELSGAYDLSVFTTDGKLLSYQEVDFFSGEKEKIVALNRLDSSGTYFFRLQSKQDQYTFTGRFVLLR
ncbi:T9SS type A sorting domain-containing protein [Phaeodactylibacter luteus]|uniref:T9SS type A sorting domain-containing protein n=1 Tax=Phaeodactylibacter luteus TaxID=1564516 RepID=A0A5C6RHX2_9BACT|nr:T9SS type A sorting domain-containing protein [Phaeodactylibacter luteus]TXB58620.1 T9SS type A sorting domain-containing protein [Phaeodactylibacter luteus]